MRSLLTCTGALLVAATLGFTQASPPAETSVTIGGKTITIKYSAPSVRGRDIFSPSGLISHDGTYPVWRAGANSATALHTDAALDIKGLQVPPGDYTIFCLVKDPNAWELIINKQTGQWGLEYHQDRDLGRVKMDMSKPPSLIEKYKMTLSATGPHTGKLEMAWENHVASVPFTVK